jgi:hypothetical protein
MTAQSVGGIPGVTNMAAKTKQVQDFVKEQFEEAQKRIVAIEGEAKKALGNLVAKGKESRKELRGVLKRFNAKDLKFQDFGKKAEEAIDAIQTRLIQVSGVASQSQIKELNKELHRLAKKVDGLLDKKKPEARA